MTALCAMVFFFLPILLNYTVKKIMKFSHNLNFSKLPLVLLSE